MRYYPVRTRVTPPIGTRGVPVGSIVMTTLLGVVCGSLLAMGFVLRLLTNGEFP